MKVNPKELSVQLNRDQAYFVSCWNNMVHEQSLDSHRVRVTNPEYALAEYTKLAEMDKKSRGGERKQVRDELVEVLSNDPTLKRSPYALPVQRLLSILGSAAVDKEDAAGPTNTMARYFIVELRALITERYVSDVLRLLRDVLVTGSTEPEPVKFLTIRDATNNLLSTLISRGTSLRSLFNYYRLILLGGAGPFADRFDGVATNITSQAQTQVHVVVALDNVSRPSEIPAHVGGFNFFQTSPIPAPPASQLGPRAATLRAYLSPFRTRLFASVQINAKDARAAGAEALERLNAVVNLLRFEYETAHLTIPEMFAYQTGSEPSRAYAFATVIPNPTSIIDGAGVAAFVAAVNELVQRQFKAEGLDRIHAAFRLYRTGLDTNAIDNKYMNWWTALEYLVRGADEKASGIGDSIEELVAPVLALEYLPKHLSAHRSLLLDMKAQLTRADGSGVDVKVLNHLGLLDLFSDAHVAQQVQNLVSGYPYIEQHVRHFISVLPPTPWLSQMRGHEKRVRAHVQRLWRARCDIVHSASKPASLVLLCANLEYYLKTVLFSLLREFRMVPTLSGPREFFERQSHEYAELQADLASGSDHVRRRLLGRVS